MKENVLLIYYPDFGNITEINQTVLRAIEGTKTRQQFMLSAWQHMYPGDQLNKQSWMRRGKVL